jgi:hypothetical protein
MTHKAGESRVCGAVAGVPSTNFVVGALQFNSLTNQLYRDNGSTMSAIGTGDHGNLTGLGDNDHTQYIRVGTEDDVSALTVPSVIGLKQDSGSYADADVMPRALHIGTDPSGGAMHDNGVFDGAGLATSSLRASKLKLTTTTDPSARSTSKNDLFEITLGARAFLPSFSATGVNCIIDILPIVLAEGSWENDYVARFTLDVRDISPNPGTISMSVANWSDV